MEKLLEKILGVVDYTQESRSNIDIVLFVMDNIQDIIEAAQTIKLDGLEAEKEKYLKESLPELIKDALSTELDQETIDKIIEQIKKRG